MANYICLCDRDFYTQEEMDKYCENCHVHKLAVENADLTRRLEEAQETIAALEKAMRDALYLIGHEKQDAAADTLRAAIDEARGEAG